MPAWPKVCLRLGHVRACAALGANVSLGPGGIPQRLLRVGHQSRAAVKQVIAIRAADRAAQRVGHQRQGRRLRLVEAGDLIAEEREHPADLDGCADAHRPAAGDQVVRNSVVSLPYESNTTGLRQPLSVLSCNVQLVAGAITSKRSPGFMACGWRRWNRSVRGSKASMTDSAGGFPGRCQAMLHPRHKSGRRRSKGRPEGVAARRNVWVSTISAAPPGRRGEDSLTAVADQIVVDVHVQGRLAEPDAGDRRIAGAADVDLVVGDDGFVLAHVDRRFAAPFG